jgi:hypothetical protein
MGPQPSETIPRVKHCQPDLRVRMFEWKVPMPAALYRQLWNTGKATF